VSFVLDASVTLRWCFADGSPSDLDYASRVLAALRETGATVPSVWSLEVANVLVRAEATGAGGEAHTESFLAVLQQLDIDEDDGRDVFGSTLHLARHHRLSAYDASYLDLALRRGLPIASLDADLLRAAERAAVPRFLAPQALRR